MTSNVSAWGIIPPPRQGSWKSTKLKPAALLANFIERGENKMYLFFTLFYLAYGVDPGWIATAAVLEIFMYIALFFIVRRLAKNGK